MHPERNAPHDHEAATLMLAEFERLWSRGFPRPNLPTPEGRALGRELVRLVGSVPDACDDCAFRAGTDPNGCGGTLLDAIACSVNGDPFLCHVHPRVCEGWRAARALSLKEPR